MKSFNVNTTQLIVRFTCPECNHTIEADVSSSIPEPNMESDTAHESENCEEEELYCEGCNTSFTIEMYKNYYEGNVRITYFDRNEDLQEINDDDIDLEESVYIV